MGIFNALMGNASEVNVQDISKEFAPILVTNEHIEKAFRVVRDMFIFTNKRLILIDKQLVGTKTGYISIPYQNIIKFSKESAGMLDLDAELKIWVKDESEPIKKTFTKGSDNINEVYRILGEHVLN